jgi:glycosyltransferase involved in cell wall biosynthesis
LSRAFSQELAERLPASNGHLATTGGPSEATPGTRLWHAEPAARGKRLSVCYVVPGHNLLSTSGPTRNVLSLAHALGRDAEVTVAFRRVLEKDPPSDLRVIEIQPGIRHGIDRVDDSAMRGLSHAEFFRYLRDLRRFVHDVVPTFDVVLEKSWLLSGYLSTLCRRRGRLGVPIENFVPNPAHNAANSLAKRLRIEIGQRIAGYHLRRAPLIIAETEHLKRGIARHWRVPEERMAVVGLGVDRALFAPRDQAAARRQLGMAPDRLVLVYSGVVDATHDLGPLLEAMARLRNPAIEMHVVGDGMLRAKHEAAARATGIDVVFHGRVAHELVPVYVAAADLCLAPYDPCAFSTGELGYSSMKVPEYLSAGRPVVTVPSGRLRDLIRHGETGFLMANKVEDWMRFLKSCPGRETLRAMGEAAAKVELMSWEDTAEAYLDLCERQLAAAAQARAAST